jgi:uncharacterized repeat protein (TIGR04138 family)
LLIIIAVALPGEISFTRRKIGSAEVLDLIVATDNRCSWEAYVFLRDALDYTTKQQKKTKEGTARRQKGWVRFSYLSQTIGQAQLCTIIAQHQSRLGLIVPK